ncbi:hypothetical protein VR44_38190, partial [Streptomyces katrae]
YDTCLEFIAALRAATGTAGRRVDAEPEAGHPPTAVSVVPEPPQEPPAWALPVFRAQHDGPHGGMPYGP